MLNQIKLLDDEKSEGSVIMAVDKPIKNKTPLETGGGRMDKQTQANLISYFYKSCRIGDAKTALIIAEKFKQSGMELYIARTLIQLIGEDCSPYEFQRLYPTITSYFTNVLRKSNRGHDMWHCVYAVAKARKWYQTEDGIELEKIRHIIKEKNLPKLDLPTWVYDFHTHEGRRRMATKTADLRLDGRWCNRFEIKERWDTVTKDITNFEEKAKAWIKSHKQEI